MAYDVKALNCENCCTGRCPYQDKTSIVKAGLRAIVVPGNMDMILSPLDLHELHKFCDGCPEYIEETHNYASGSSSASGISAGPDL